MKPTILDRARMKRPSKALKPCAHECTRRDATANDIRACVDCGSTLIRCRGKYWPNSELWRSEDWLRRNPGRLHVAADLERGLEKMGICL